MENLFDKNLRVLKHSGKENFRELLGIKKVGCHFAVQLLKNTQDSGLFFAEYSDNFNFNNFFEDVCLDLEESGAIEWVVVRFSSVRLDSDGLEKILQILASHERIEVSFDYNLCSSLSWAHNYDGVMIRIRSNRLNLIAWPLLFGPLEYFPQTRKAKEFCLFFRMKARRKQFQQLLGANRHHSHLADIPLTHSQESFDALWLQTQGKRLLELEPHYRDCAKARYTTIVPAGATRKIKEAMNYG